MRAMAMNDNGEYNCPTLGDLEEEGEEEEAAAEEMRSVAEKVVLTPISHTKQLLFHNSLSHLSNSWIVTVVAFWHAYLFWVAGCVFLAVGANELLRWWIRWYVESKVISHFRLLVYFFYTLAKSWIWVAVVGEVVRFCFLIVKDGFRLDAFEAYRKLLMGDSYQEAEEGCLYAAGWGPGSVRPVRKAVNLAIQAAIYTSLDGVPLLVFIFVSVKSGSTAGAVHSMALAVVPLACLHVLLFCVAFFLTDTYVKLSSFWEIWRHFQEGGEESSSLEHGSTDEEDHLDDGDGAGADGGDGVHGGASASPTPLLASPLKAPPPEADRTSAPIRSVSSAPASPQRHPPPSLRRASTGGNVMVTQRSHKLPVEEEEAEEEEEEAGDPMSWLPSTVRRRSVSNLESKAHAAELNICLMLCRGCLAVEALVPHMLCVGCVLIGLARRNDQVVLAGLFSALLLCGYGGAVRLLESRPQRTGSPRQEALQAWGEHQCSFTVNGHLVSRLGPASNLVAVGFLLAFNGYWRGWVSCLGLLTVLFARQCSVYVERPWGWLVGWVEGVLFHLLTAVLCLLLEPTHAVQDFLLVLVLSCLRRFGVRHHLQDGESLRNLTLFWFCVVQFVIVAILAMSMLSSWQTGLFGSAFCNKTSPDCNYTTFAYQVPTANPWPLCMMRFARKSKLEGLSLGDFGLFSTLAYESLDTIEDGLAYYFPRWHIDDKHLTTSPWTTSPWRKAANKNFQDWTTFYQFTEEGNLTSVFAVRGTQYLIDVLQDIDLWLPAVTINFFEKVGPNFAEGMVDAIAALTNIGRMGRDKQAFGELLRRVRAQMRAYPDRQFYITGHSLGGGIAKLVAAELAVLEPNRSLPAIVFAAPGVGATSYVVYGGKRTDLIARKTITVMPHNDFVSRVDTQKDATMPVACAGTALSCHSIMRTVCSIYETCGSMREGTNVSVPLKCPTNLPMEA